jgi:hypothetical protein
MAGTQCNRCTVPANEKTSEKFDLLELGGTAEAVDRQPSNRFRVNTGCND